MKLLRVLLPLLLTFMLLCGCSVHLRNSAEDLIRPAALSEKDSGVYKALKNFCDEDFVLKTPVSGDFRSSFIFYDFDGDGADEALAFYKNDGADKASMAVLDEFTDGWSVVSNLEGDGDGVYSVEACKLLESGGVQLVVLWDTSVNNFSRYLSVYTQENSNSFSGFVKIGASIRAAAYTPVDIKNRGYDELLVFNVGNGKSVDSSAALFSVSESGLQSRSATKLDGHIESYENVVSENTGRGFRAFADAFKSNGNGMLTELIVWSDYYDEIIAPYYSYSSGRTDKTSRNAYIYCCDINSDGYIEIPTDAGGISLSGGVKAIDWKRYSSVLNHVCYTLFVERDGYNVLIPKEYFEKIKASYDEKSGLLEVSEKSGKAIFSVIKTNLSDYMENTDKFAEYTEIYRDNVYIFLAECGGNSDIKIDTKTLKSMIIIGKGV